MKGCRLGLFPAFLFVVCLSSVHAQVAVHDPWLNWDLINYTGQDAYDFRIVVDTPDWTPSESFNDVFDQLTTSTSDVDGDGDQDTIVHWSSSNPTTVVAAGGVMHAGLYMKGSGSIVAADWTDFGGNTISSSIPVFATYELTVVETPVSGEDSDISMILAPPTMQQDTFVGQLGWTGIRTFMNLPAELLGLPDINDDLDLDSLVPYETTPRLGDAGGPALDPLDVYYWDFPAESFFDVFVGSTPFTGPQYESLLYAQLVYDEDGALGQNEPVPVGEFWNLNPQSPEPSTAVCLLLASVGLIMRRRRRRG